MKNKHYLVIAGIIAVLVCSLIGFQAFSTQNSAGRITRTIPAENISMNIKSEIGNIIINAPLPESPSTISIYKGTYGADGWKEFESPKLHETKSSIPNESEAHEMAKNASIPFGGIPIDAVISFVEQRIGHGVNLTTGKYVTNYPKSTVISYFRELNGMPIEGSGEEIRVELGENGELLLFSKRWRTWEKVGDVPIINATRAVEKLQKGETIGQLLKTVDLNIHTIQLGYYMGYPDREEDTLEPIWIFKGTTTEGSNLKLFVDARETGSVLNFANFTANPASGKVPLAVFFNDTSRGTIQLWFWDFGDGGRSEERDPVHTYQNPGTYTVSLRAFDESRLADCIKTDYITVRLPAPPIANFTATPTSGNALLSVTFNDTSANTPTSWLWTFGDGTNSTIQHPIHIYTSAGNYTISLNVTNEDGANATIKENYISVSNPPPTTQPTTIVTTTVTTTIPTKPTTNPTPSKTRAPLSPMVILSGLACAGLAYIKMKKN